MENTETVNTSNSSYYACRRQKFQKNDPFSSSSISSKCSSFSMKPRSLDNITIFKSFILLLLILLLLLNISTTFFDFNFFPSSFFSFSYLSIPPPPPPPPPSSPSSSSSLLSLENNSSSNSDVINYNHSTKQDSIHLQPPPSTVPYSEQYPANSSIHYAPLTDFDSPSPLPETTMPVEVPKSSIKNCDITKGEWIRDWNAPYYTNKTCYTIQEHQNCMKFGRPNLDFLKWRWKPDDCDLPLFDPNRFLHMMKGKTLAFVGDSLARNQMQSLLCLLSQVMYPEDISENSDDNFKSFIYPSYNFKIQTYWSPFLVKANETGEPNFRLWNMYLDKVDNRWASHIEQFDYIIISGGNWFNRPSIFYEKDKIVGCLYCPDKTIPQKSMHYSHRRAFRTAFKAINSPKRKFNGTVVLRTVSPSHFENGFWNTGGDCKRTEPFRRGEAKMDKEDGVMYKVQKEEFENGRREGKRRGMEYRVVDMTRAMLLRGDGHPSRYGHWPEDRLVMPNDCVHWCLPGPVDVWNDVLFQVLSV